MESRAKLLGHPVHPMLVVFPLGLLSTAAVFDVLYMTTRRTVFATVAFWNITLGIVGAVVAAIFGLWDWLFIPDGTRAKQIGLWHGAGNAVVLVLAVVSWLLRRRDSAHRPSGLASNLSLTGMALSLVTAWFGGELVDRLGVGVDAGAHLNASSSLSGKPAATG